MPSCRIIKLLTVPALYRAGEAGAKKAIEKVNVNSQKAIPGIQ